MLSKMSEVSLPIIYSRKIDSEAAALLNQAKAEWMSHSDATGAQIVAGIYLVNKSSGKEL
ncbi:MAG: hypothetical protein ACLTOV_06735 [Phocaeicola sp.]